MEAALWGLLGTIVGALASIGTTVLASRNAYRIHQDKARDERAERASAFQRQTLLELQEAIHDVLRLSHKAHVEDLKAAHASRKWGENLLPPDLDQSVSNAKRRFLILVERVSDNDLRVKVKALVSATSSMLLAPSQEQAEFHVSEIADQAGPVFEMIGVVLRRHF
jgi:hypothetical protein